MTIRTLSASALAVALALSFGLANAASALSVSCAGAPAASSITWTASPTGGIAPIALVWGNGSTSSAQTLSYTPGTYSMTIQATDASSSVATSSCSATVAQALPAIASFTASPASVTTGQSATLSWSVTNASSTSIDNGVGAVSGAPVTVSPTVTTTYTLSAVNPAGTTTAQTTVTVNATSTGGSTLQQQIQNLLQQIHDLQQQLANLLAGQLGGGTGTTTPSVVPPGQTGKAACIALNRNLGEGDSGDDVKSIQQMLSEDPEDGFNLAPTGFFGPLTARAMAHFQERNGIASSSVSGGNVGPLTRGFFERRCGKGLEDSPKGNGPDAGSPENQSSSTPAVNPGNPEHGKSGEEHGQGNGGDNGRDN